jgi:hypothetical protein
MTSTLKPKKNAQAAWASGCIQQAPKPKQEAWREHWTPLAAPKPVYRAGAWDFMQHPSLYGSKQGESK